MNKAVPEQRFAQIGSFNGDEADHNLFPIPPWVEVQIMTYPEALADGQVRWELQDTGTPTVPNSNDLTSPFPNSVGVDMPQRERERDYALDYIAISLAQHLHELLEWVKVDGKPLAIAHPESDMLNGHIPDRTEGGHADQYGYWDWSIDKMRTATVAYCRRYPPSKGITP